MKTLKKTFFVCFSVLTLVGVLMACDSSVSSKESEKPTQVEEASAEIISLTGDTLYPPKPSAKNLENLKLAEETFQQNSQDEQAIIWMGRRTAYLSRYQEAIAIYSKGLQIHPDSYRLLRHRGHRYISIREFDKAIADLLNASKLAPDKIETEADGMPNKLNMPLSSTQFNIWYHLGLAYYLKGAFPDAADAYQKCLSYSINDDLLCATTDWLYMTLRKMGEADAASQTLSAIHPEMDIIENTSYHKRLLMYKGVLAPDSLLQVSDTDTDPALSIATQGYGVGNYYLMQGDTSQAYAIFKQVLAGSHWSAFGYIAAEVEMHNK